MPQNESNDPLFDFQVQVLDGNLIANVGKSFPKKALAYLENYLYQTRKYKNILPSHKKFRFSLYQPELTSEPGKRSLYYRLKRKYNRLRVPAVATMGVTKICQCECEHCSADYHMNSKQKELSTNDYIEAFDQTAKLGVSNIILLGGEPLINKNINLLIKSVNKRLTTVTMFTNGELLTKMKCQELKESGLSGIFVSLDSSDAKEHDSMRVRPGLFQKAIIGISNAKEAGIPVAISSYLTTQRIEEKYFESIMDLARDNKVNEVTFFDAIPVGRLKGDCSFLNTQARMQIQELTNTYRKKEDYPAVTPQSILTSAMGSSFCFAANTQFYLSSTGEFCPCDFTPLSIGQFPKESIATLWEKIIASELYKERSKTCRMQDESFRSRTIDKIPKDATLPFPIEKIATL